MPVFALAWWPGGRAALNATSALPPSSAWATAHAPPAAWTAASHEPALTGVSESSAPPPARLIARTASRWRSVWTARRSSGAAAGAARRS